MATLAQALLPSAAHARSDGFRWVAWKGYVPSYAIEAGRENGKALYACRAEYRNGRHIGKVVNGKCNIAWGGQEIVLNDYEVFATRGAAPSPVRPTANSAELRNRAGYVAYMEISWMEGGRRRTVKRHSVALGRSDVYELPARVSAGSVYVEAFARGVTGWSSIGGLNGRPGNTHLCVEVSGTLFDPSISYCN